MWEKIKVERSLRNEKYVHIKLDDNSFYGGNQGWWTDSNSVISRYGCGVIAMCDLEIYLSGKFNGNQKVINNCDTFIIYNEYKKYVEKRFYKTYRIYDLPIIKKLGLLPWKMTRGIRTFLIDKNDEKGNVKWAPSKKCEVISEYISGMLKNDIPVVASYDCTIKGKPLNYFIKDAIGNIKEASQFTSHYFVITGIDGDFFKISTYGETCFVLSKDWYENLSYFTNILYIG